jgi:hypothetical protein
LSPKQIKYFGSARQRAALKAARRRKAASHRVRARKANPRRRRATKNPALVVTLGAVNPKRRKVAMAQKKARRRNAQRRRHTRRNPAVVLAAPRRTRRRRLGGRRRNRRYSVRRYRNPAAVFGRSIFSRDAMMMVGGGLLGVAGTKLLPTLVSGYAGGIASSTLGRIGISAASAWVCSFAAGKAAGSPFGDAVLFGGLMQVASVALNALLPTLNVGGVSVALSGMGELVDGSFSVPQNPVRAAALASAAAAAAASKTRVNMNGLQRAFGTAL